MKFDRTDYIKQPSPIEKELKILFKQNEALTIFEIGACEGEDSIRYSRLFPSSKVHAFEPLPNNIKLIESNLIKYGIKNVSYYNIALSSVNGSAEFYVSQGRPDGLPETDWDFGNKSSSLLPPDKHKDLAAFIEFKDKITVQTLTLESFCKNNKISIIDFIHMDVQGAELMVLQGAGEFLSSIKVIWLEVSKIHVYKNQPLADDISEFMMEHNFVLAKDCVDGLQGDHLYISKSFFPNYKQVISKLNDKQLSIFSKFFKRFNL
jgi:FkbM family methyltransferase